MVMSNTVATLLVAGIFGIAWCANCPCKDDTACNNQVGKTASSKSILVFSKGSTDVERWQWDTISALVVPANFDISNKAQAETMCTAHSKGRRFGITVTMDLTGKLNSSSPEMLTWIKNTVKKQKDWHADLINIDLLPYFSSDVGSTKEDHVALVMGLKNLKKELDESSDEPTQLHCVVPWKPPCAESEAACDFTWMSTDVCDYFIINPDSFLDIDDVKCRARAIIPFSKLLYGISEYNSHSVSMNRIILGIAWHGYDYTCSDIVNDICTAKEVTVENSTQIKCSFDYKPISIGDIAANHDVKYAHHKMSDIYYAPYFNYNARSVKHQVWFEDHTSLSSKYRLVMELGLQGIGIMYGDDLSAHFTPALMTSSGAMWSWVAHEFLLASSHHPVTHDLHTADTVAGVAVGCLILGTVLGVLFSCLAMRKRIKKPKRAFLRDTDPGMEEFMDEDPNL